MTLELPQLVPLGALNGLELTLLGQRQRSRPLTIGALIPFELQPASGLAVSLVVGIDGAKAESNGDREQKCRYNRGFSDQCTASVQTACVMRQWRTARRRSLPAPGPLPRDDAAANPTFFNIIRPEPDSLAELAPILLIQQCGRNASSLTSPSSDLLSGELPRPQRGFFLADNTRNIEP
jgi:hypothetical protein